MNLIQLTPQIIELGSAAARVGLVIDQRLFSEKRLVVRDGKYIPITSDDAVKTDWAYVYFAPPLAVVDTLDHVPIVIETVEKGLNLQRNAVKRVFLDTDRIRSDHPEQWVRGFVGRKGHVQKGRVYGEAIEQDLVFEEALSTSKSKEAGWPTHFFGGSVKVRVTYSGCVTIHANPQPSQFLRFIRREILPYEIPI